MLALRLVLSATALSLGLAGCGSRMSVPDGGACASLIGANERRLSLGIDPDDPKYRALVDRCVDHRSIRVEPHERRRRAATRGMEAGLAIALPGLVVGGAFALLNWPSCADEVVDPPDPADSSCWDDEDEGSGIAPRREVIIFSTVSVGLGGLVAWISSAFR